MKWVLALSLAHLVLMLAFTASSPALHKLIHADADEPGHHCAVTEFALGHLAPAVAAPLLIGLVLLFGGVALLAETFQFPLVVYNFSRSRAPPLPSFPLV